MRIIAPLHGATAGNPTKTSSLSIDDELRDLLTAVVETSTPMKGRNPNYSTNNSSILDLSPQSCASPSSSRMIVEIGDEKTLVARRAAVGERLSGRLHTNHKRTVTDIGFSEIESFTQVMVAEFYPAAVGAGLQRAARPGPPASLLDETREVD